MTTSINHNHEASLHTNHTKPYRVLTIDGGGMRGLYTAILLDTLARRFADERKVSSLDVGKAFDLIVGTSTGAILGTTLMQGIPIHDIVQLYREAGPRIFRDPVPIERKKWEIVPALWKWVWRNWKKAVNKTDVLRESLTPLLGDTTLKEAYEKRGIGLCVPAINMANHKGTILKTPHNPFKGRDGDYKLVDVLLASISAPILFPIATIDDPSDPTDYRSLIDGGLWANNPVLIGMSEALMMAQPRQPIEILSLSTCAPPAGTFITKQHTNWGLKDWRVGTRVLSLVLETQATAYHEMARILSRYVRQSCKVVRLPQSSPSSEQQRYLLMDQATPRSLKVLSDLAKFDAEYIYSLAIDRANPDFALINDIFTAMPEAQRS
jgi:predicted acylesterase/phospholipase RssA